MSVADNLARIRAAMAAACQRAGRAEDAVRLVAVSKRQPLAKLEAALAAGQLDLGENYGQELRDKASALAGRAPAPRWHFIGPIQSNKIRYIAPHAGLVHTVASVEIARKLVERAAREQRTLTGLIEVNIAAEPQKAGLLPEAVAEALGEIQATGLQVAGLMCMPPFGLPLATTRGYFVKLRELGEALVDQQLLEPGHELSMGMSDDFTAAIEEGATLVRVGTAIFGARESA